MSVQCKADPGKISKNICKFGVNRYLKIFAVLIKIHYSWMIYIAYPVLLIWYFVFVTGTTLVTHIYSLTRFVSLAGGIWNALMRKIFYFCSTENCKKQFHVIIPRAILTGKQVIITHNLISLYILMRNVCMQRSIRIYHQISLLYNTSIISFSFIIITYICTY